MEHSTRKDKAIACVLVAISVIYFLGCLNTTVGRLRNPGAGLIPWLISICLLVFTVINVIQAFRCRDNRARPPAGNRTAVIGTAIVVLTYPVLLYVLKAILATFVSTFILLRLMRYKRVAGSLIIALVVSASVYLIFGLILEVPFPSGPIEQLIWRLR